MKYGFLGLVLVILIVTPEGGGTGLAPVERNDDWQSIIRAFNDDNRRFGGYDFML